jgi:hypothetical protein
MPETISSSSSSLGSVASARPSSTRFCMAVGQVPTGMVADVLDLEEVDDLLDALAGPDLLAPGASPRRTSRRRHCGRMWQCMPTSRLSTTVSCLNTARFWKVRPMPMADSGARPCR